MSTDPDADRAAIRERAREVAATFPRPGPRTLARLAALLDMSDEPDICHIEAPRATTSPNAGVTSGDDAMNHPSGASHGH